MKSLIAIFALLAALGLAACGSDDDEPETTAAAPASESEEEAMKDEDEAMKEEDEAMKEEKAEDEAMKEEDAMKEGGKGTEIVLADSEFGDMLFDSRDQAIYLFDKESSSESECYGACAEAWPPVLTKGDPVAGDGTNGNLLGTTERDDGSLQVTYNGHPLYYYVDEGPGEVLCHGVDEFGGLWLVVDAAGNALPA
jgi:predicted lipoprotein with Yx(FWY)xxD motif